MSDDQQIAIPVNLPDDCSAEQPPKDDAAAACLVQQPKDDAAAACPVQPPKDDDAAAACSVQPPKDDAAAACPVQPPKDDAAAACPVQPPKDDAAAAACPVQPPKDDAAACPVQPPKDDVAACPVQPPKDDAACPLPPPNSEAEMSDVLLLSKDDDAASFAPPPPNDDAVLAPMPNISDGAASPPEGDAGPAPPLLDDIAHPACQLPLPLDEAVPLAPGVEPGFSKANCLENTNVCDKGVIVKQEIKHETIDLGNDTFFYDDNNQTIQVKSPKVGFDRGLEPDHIVGATEVNGKLMFLIAWKNSEVADLLESTVVYKKCPQLAIQFFEARLKYCPNEKMN